MNHVWTCQCCGKQYNTLPLSYASDAPDPWLSIPEADRRFRGELTSDACVIDGTEFYVRGLVEISVIDCNETFAWNVWVSVSKQSFERIGELWDVEVRDDEPPFFAWLCTAIPIYPQTLLLKTSVHLRNGGKRPFIQLEPTDHPFAVEQREGISLKRVEDIASQLLRHA